MEFSLGGIFAGWNFRGWNFRGWNFRGWNFRITTELNFLNKKTKDLLKLTLHRSISKSSQSLKFNIQPIYLILSTKSKTVFLNRKVKSPDCRLKTTMFNEDMDCLFTNYETTVKDSQLVK